MYLKRAEIVFYNSFNDLNDCLIALGHFVGLYNLYTVWLVRTLIINVRRLKATFSVHKLIPKNAQMTTLY